MSTSATALATMPVLHAAGYHEGNRQVPFHSHPHSELILPLRGEIGIDVESRSFAGRAGTLYIMPAGVPHNQRGQGYWRTLCVLFSHSPHLFSDSARTLDIDADKILRRWLGDLATLYETKGAETAAAGLLFCVLARISSLEHTLALENTLHPSLAVAAQFLLDHVSQEFDAQRLAAAACSSYSHLSALFRRQFGCGPLKYHQNLRMERACKLLRNPYLRLDEIARQIGYSDTNYFVRLFRQIRGIPPGQWRSKYLNAADSESK